MHDNHDFDSNGVCRDCGLTLGEVATTAAHCTLPTRGQIPQDADTGPVPVEKVSSPHTPLFLSRSGVTVCVCAKCGLVFSRSENLIGHCHFARFPTIAADVLAGILVGTVRPHKVEFLNRDQPSQGAFCLDCGSAPSADRVCHTPPGYPLLDTANPYPEYPRLSAEAFSGKKITLAPSADPPPLTSGGTGTPAGRVRTVKYFRQAVRLMDRGVTLYYIDPDPPADLPTRGQNSG
jgi:hypothetical protein